MDRRRIFAIILLALAILIFISVPVWLFTPLGSNFSPPNLNAPPLTPIAFKPLPKDAPQAVLTPKGTPHKILATEGILLDADTGNILYEKKAENPVPMASTTKIMTALIAIRSGNLNQMITIGQDAVNEVKDNGGSGANLVAGDRIKLQDLLYALMLPSGDDAAVAIADGVAGSTQNFVTIMNVEARRLRLYQTRYYNVDGLEATDSRGNIIDGVHYTTPYDLARLTRYAMSIPLFAQVVGAKKYTVPTDGTVHHAYQWDNINQLLFNYSGTIGVKTGWTPQAGGCLVAAAKRNGHTLISVVLNSANEATRFRDAEMLLTWGFSLPSQVLPS